MYVVMNRERVQELREVMTRTYDMVMGEMDKLQ